MDGLLSPHVESTEDAAHEIATPEVVDEFSLRLPSSTSPCKSLSMSLVRAREHASYRLERSGVRLDVPRLAGRWTSFLFLRQEAYTKPPMRPFYFNRGSILIVADYSFRGVITRIGA